MNIDLHLGDCLDILPTLESESVDAVITDPPYPCIKRDYGYWTVDEWWAMMMPVVAETRRILKPTGSAVFILQPNSEHVGQMRGWLWEFMAWVCREWNMVQDVWAWQVSARPDGVAQFGLLRQSLKACVWAGHQTCYRQQNNVLWTEADSSAARRRAKRASGKLVSKTQIRPKGSADNEKRWREAVLTKGGVTPFNVLPITSDKSQISAGAHGHGAGTPLKLADWWTRYICPPGGTVADWFMGSGTMGVAAVQNGCNFVGIEKYDWPGYFPTAQERIEAERAKTWQREMEIA